MACPLSWVHKTWDVVPRGCPVREYWPALGGMDKLEGLPSGCNFGKTGRETDALCVFDAPDLGRSPHQGRREGRDMHFDWRFGQAHCYSPLFWHYLVVLSFAGVFIPSLPVELNVACSGSSTSVPSASTTLGILSSTSMTSKTTSRKSGTWPASSPLRMSSSHCLCARTISRCQCPLTPWKCTVTMCRVGILVLGIAEVRRGRLQVSTLVPDAQMCEPQPCFFLYVHTGLRVQKICINVRMKNSSRPATCLGAPRRTVTIYCELMKTLRG